MVVLSTFAQTLQQQYGHYVFQDALQRTWLNNVPYHYGGQNMKFWGAVKDACRRWKPSAGQSQRPRPSVRGPDVRPSSPISVVPTKAPTTALDRISALGTIRGLYMVASPRGGFSVTLKATLHSGQAVYRHGYIAKATDLEMVLNHWVTKGVWTPDKQ